ncbi:hypothetical protein TWF718_010432 [Orbilia javanica]|uniref:Ribose-5-phosphate isomerase n=1 Tax=Orbilia javanica TaxID=47235 RepID=A0AAN8RE71_9PEZI
MYFLSNLKTIRSPAVKNVVTSLIIIYVLRNFCSRMSGEHKARISDSILERMERLLTRVRSGSLKKKGSNVSRKGKEEEEGFGDLKSLDSIGIQPLEEGDDGSGILKRGSRDFSISATPPGVYGSAVSLMEDSVRSAAEPLPKNPSRRSSLSKPGKKPSLQHVGFQSPELEPKREDDPTPIPTPTPTPGPSRANSTKKSKKDKHPHMSSLISLISNATHGTSKSGQSLKRSRSATTIRRLAAFKAVSDNFPTTRPAYIAIGSGALMLQVVERISQYSYNQLADITFVSTGVASEHIMASYKLRPITSLNLLSPETRIDVYFDTADKVDDNLNCIRGGRSGSLHSERMVALRSECFVCIIDHRKRVPTLFTTGRGMPVEITPESYFHVIESLRANGATAALRSADPVVSGPCVTQKGNYIIDAIWPALEDTEGEVEALADVVKGVYGVVDHGLFYAGESGWCGRPKRVYVGLKDGAVDVLGDGS